MSIIVQVTNCVTGTLHILYNVMYIWDLTTEHHHKQQQLIEQNQVGMAKEVHEQEHTGIVDTTDPYLEVYHQKRYVRQTTHRGVAV